MLTDFRVTLNALEWFRLAIWKENNVNVSNGGKMINACEVYCKNLEKLKSLEKEVDELKDKAYPPFKYGDKVRVTDDPFLSDVTLTVVRKGWSPDEYYLIFDDGNLGQGISKLRKNLVLWR